MASIWGIKAWSATRGCRVIKFINVFRLYASYSPVILPLSHNAYTAPVARPTDRVVQTSGNAHNFALFVAVCLRRDCFAHNLPLYFLAHATLPQTALLVRVLSPFFHACFILPRFISDTTAAEASQCPEGVDATLSIKRPKRDGCVAILTMDDCG